MRELKNKVKEFRNTVLNKQDKLTPGENISIDENNVISSLSGKKVDKYQGVENAGKALVVGSDGNVVPGSVTLSDAETLNLLIEEDMLPAVRNADGAILTDQNGNIVLRY